MRTSGILMHLTSLPGPDGIGSMGREARKFVDFLQSTGTSLWQVLPIGPTGYGESPYQSPSAFAGNPMLIDIDTLIEEGLLTVSDGDRYVPSRSDKVEYDAVRKAKEALLRKCWEQSGKKLAAEVDAFAAEHAWLEDYALFTALKNQHNREMWSKWPERGLRMREEAALAKARADLADEIGMHRFIQYLFFRQWAALKQYANDRGVLLFGDMPIYCAEDSADAWAHPEVFQLDKDRVPLRVAGVPPDYFSEDGQLWGNPLYDWDRLMDRDFDWWVERMRSMSKLFDLIRVDHFIGFANYYSIPYGAPNAKGGKWILGPGEDLFLTFRRELPGLNIVAEDLGCVTARVKALLKFVGYPGMRVLSFAFGADDANTHDPQNYVKNLVVYTGTHDNDTVLGWLSTASSEDKAQAMEELGFTRPEEAPMAFIRGVMNSVADRCVIPMQDWLELGSEARMNAPGKMGGNWAWRMEPGKLTGDLAERIRRVYQDGGRGPWNREVPMPVKKPRKAPPKTAMSAAAEAAEKAEKAGSPDKA